MLAASISRRLDDEAIFSCMTNVRSVSYWSRSCRKKSMQTVLLECLQTATIYKSELCRAIVHRGIGTVWWCDQLVYRPLFCTVQDKTLHLSRLGPVSFSWQLSYSLLITAWSIAILEKQKVSDSVDIEFRCLYGTRGFSNVLTRGCQWTLPSPWSDESCP